MPPVGAGILDGQVAIVAGGGRGIGSASATALAAAGAAVVVAARSSADTQAVADQILRIGGIALPVVVDIADATRARALVEQAVDTFGRVDILVDCAAAMQPMGVATWEVAPEAWIQPVAVNLFGLFFLVHATLPHMLRQGIGRILYLSSGAGEFAFPGASAYCAARAGANHFIRVLAAELQGSRVTVNTVYPGMTDTDGLREFRSSWAGRPRMVGGAPRHPSGPAGMILWLCSPATAHVTGQTVRFDDPAVQRELRVFFPQVRM